MRSRRPLRVPVPPSPATCHLEGETRPPQTHPENPRFAHSCAHAQSPARPALCTVARGCTMVHTQRSTRSQVHGHPQAQTGPRHTPCSHSHRERHTGEQVVGEAPSAPGPERLDRQGWASRLPGGAGPGSAAGPRHAARARLCAANVSAVTPGEPGRGWGGWAVVSAQKFKGREGRCCLSSDVWLEGREPQLSLPCLLCWTGGWVCVGHTRHGAQGSPAAVPALAVPALSLSYGWGGHPSSPPPPAPALLLPAGRPGQCGPGLGSRVVSRGATLSLGHRVWQSRLHPSPDV